jgi:formate hydrogenlyase transcriptional activator
MSWMKPADVSLGPYQFVLMPTAVQTSVHFEGLLANLSARFVNLPSDKVDGAIQDAQRDIVQALELDRSTLFRFGEGDGDMRVTHLWARPETPIVEIPESGQTSFPWAFRQIIDGKIVSFSRVDEMPASDREGLRKVGVKSNVSVPMIVGGRVVGVLSFGTMTHEREWAPELVVRLRLIAEVFANALDRKRTHEELTAALSEVKRLKNQLAAENAFLRREVTSLQSNGLVVGRSPAIMRALEQAAQVAATSSTVLLTGETGTGKELFASHIHNLSARRQKVMVRVNCAAIPSALIESELFGREKGAYTGALSRQFGRFEVADKSSLFLDEIGDLPVEVQVKLLRVLQEKEVERLGSNRPLKVDVRIIAATHRNLEDAIAQGTFRDDLYYRLNVFPIRIPPLRERIDDIPLLVWGFVDEFSRAFGKQIESVSRDNMAALQRYPWPGNIRELRNVVERAVIVATGPRLTIDLPPRKNGGPAPSIALVDIERDHILSVLERVSWRVRGSGGGAELLGMKPSTLESRMIKLGIRRPRA